MIGGGFIVWAGLGLWATDVAESRFGWAASEQDKQRLKGSLGEVKVVPIDRGTVTDARMGEERGQGS